MASLGYTELNLWSRDDIFKIHKKYILIYIIYRHWYGSVSWDSSSFPVNTMAANGLAT